MSSIVTLYLIEVHLIERKVLKGVSPPVIEVQGLTVTSMPESAIESVPGISPGLTRGPMACRHCLAQPSARGADT